MEENHERIRIPLDRNNMHREPSQTVAEVAKRMHTELTDFSVAPFSMPTHVRRIAGNMAVVEFEVL